jgi:hypothetical protein
LAIKDSLRDWELNGDPVGDWIPEEVGNPHIEANPSDPLEGRAVQAGDHFPVFLLDQDEKKA